MGALRQILLPERRMIHRRGRVPPPPLPTDEHISSGRHVRALPSSLYSRITEFCSSVYIDFRQRTRVARGCPRTVSLIGYYVGPIPQFPPPLILPIVSTRLISKPQNVSDARVPHGNRGNANIVVKGDRSSLLEMPILRISENRHP